MESQIASLLVSQIVQVTILSAVIWGITKLIAKSRSHLAHMLWLIVLIKCITPPICHNPASPFCWNWSTQQVASQSNESTQPSPENTGVTNSITENSNPFIGPIFVKTKPATELQPSEDLASQKQAKPENKISTIAPPKTISWRRTILLLWLIGVSVFLVCALVRSTLFLKWLKSLPRQKNSELETQLQQLSTRLGIKRSVRLEIVDGLVGPAVFGFFKPRIVLPQAIVQNKTAKQLEPLLAHELIHLRRGDLAWSALQALATSLFWFHPLVWLASLAVSRESERSCDEETVASLGCHPADYARCLLDVLEKKQHLRSAPVVPGIRQVDITSARLERVMKFGNGIRKSTPVWIRLAFVALAIIVLPGAAAAVQKSNDSPKPLEVAVESQLAEEVNSTKDSGLETREYDISAMLKHLEGVDSDSTPENLIKGVLGRRHPIHKAVVKETQTFHLDRDGKPVPVELPIVEQKLAGYETPELDFDLQNKMLTIKTTEKIHLWISKAVDHFSKFGFHQIVIETRFISTDQETWNNLYLPWEFANAKGGKAEFDSAWQKPHPDAFSNGTSKPTEKDLGAEMNVQTSRYVQKNAPTVYTILDDKQVLELIQKTFGQSMINEAPRIISYNGQKSNVCDETMRPFVTSVKKVTGDKATAHQPIISVIPDGTRLTQTSVISKDGKHVELDCELVISQILSVDQFEIQHSENSGVAIQVPEVDITRITSKINLPDGETLALSVLRTDGKQMIALVTCRIIQPTPPELDAINPNPMPANFDGATVHMNVSAPPKIREEKPRTENQSTATKFSISTSEPKRTGVDYDKLAKALLESNDLTAEIKGHVDFEIDGSKIVFSGKSMVIQVDDDFYATAKEVSFTLEDGDKMQLDLIGDAKYDMDELKFRGDRLSMKDPFILTIEGNASLSVGETEFRADSIKLGESELIELVGNASVVQKEEARSFVGQKIVYNCEDETLKLDQSDVLHTVLIEPETETHLDAQVLPSAYYIEDDIQYFPKGEEFKLQSEPAALKKAKED